MAEQTAVVEEKEKLVNRVNIPADEQDALGLEAIKEAEEEEKRKAAGEPEPEPSKEEGKEKAPELTEEEKVKAAEAEKQKEEERILNAKEEELSVEDKAKKAEIVKVRDEAAKKAVEAEVEAYAKEHQLSSEETRTFFDESTKIMEKYKGDPKQLARANLALQRHYSKVESELKTLKEAKPPEPPAPELTVDYVLKLMDEGKITVGGKAVPKEQLLEAYRKENEDITATLEDEAVSKLIAKDIKSSLEKQHEVARGEMKIKAKEKRDTLISSLSEADRAYADEIKPILEHIPDVHILNEGFSLNDTIMWAKGKKYDALVKEMEGKVKEAEERGFKRGQEEAKIIGVKAGPKQPGNAPVKGKRSLTDNQKKIARERYQDAYFPTDEDKFNAYIEFLEDEEKEKQKK
jgi:hypothetical protein